MATQAEIWQAARLLGRDEFLSCLSIASLDDLQGLDQQQLTKLRACTLENANRITRALVHEAAARDDVASAPQAQSFLEQRLTMLGEILSDEARDRIRDGFRALTADWGRSGSGG